MSGIRMKRATVEVFASRVENSSHFRRLLTFAGWLVACFGGCVFQTALAQSSSVLQANTVIAGGETRPASSSLQPASAITVEAWVTAPTAVTNYPAFVSYGLDTSPYESYVLQAQTIDSTHPADFWFLTGTGTSHSLHGTTLLAPGTQYHLVATYDGTTAKLYVNGSVEASAAVSGSIYYPGGGLGLGRNYNRPADNFAGVVKGAAIYNAALSATQIAAHYAAGPPTPVYTLGRVPSGGITQAGSSSLQPASAFTLTAWINAPATLTNYPAFISYGQDTTPYESYILQAQAIDGGHAADVYFLTGTGTSHQLHGTTLLHTGTQYFVVATYDGTTAGIYVNGALENTLSASGALYYPGSGLGVGRKYSTTTANFSGTESGVAVYGAALSADRIAAQFQAGSPPTVPGSLVPTVVSGTQINLSWTASTDAVAVTGYLIERCTGTGCSNFAQVGNSATAAFSDAGLTAATTYTYRVRAVNSGSNVSDYSAVAAATTTGGGGGDTTPPSNPTGLSATAVSGSQINLSWTASTDNVGVTGYKVERCPGASCSTFAQIATPTGTTFSDTGLTALTSYSYRVRATDAAGNLSGYSNTASATTSGSLSAPSGLGAPAFSSIEVDLSWVGSSGGTGAISYLVESCSGTSCSSFTQIGSSATTTYNVMRLTANTSYTFRVRATDTPGDLSAYSSTFTLTTPLSGPDCN
jgi:chitodextrinase